MVDQRKLPYYVVAVIFVAVLAGGAFFVFKNPPTQTNQLPQTSSSTSLAAATTSAQATTTTATEIPQFTQKTVLAGLSHPWDLIMLADQSFIFSERPNILKYFKDGKVTALNAPGDTYVRGEGGMLGLAIDPEFATNNFIYACFNSTIAGNPEVRLARFKFNPVSAKLSDRKDIITGLPSITSGRHSGCQPEFGPDGFLWVGTGDAATGTNPQSRTSLGGKVLRVDRDGKAAPGNQGAPFDARIFNYGHRNVQGLGFFNPTAGFSVPGLSIEQGSTINDEVNPLVTGNFGWGRILLTTKAAYR
jgi:glucose/arabinose dehydrogenase